jgi:hypothetical protein
MAIVNDNGDAVCVDAQLEQSRRRAALQEKGNHRSTVSVEVVSRTLGDTDTDCVRSSQLQRLDTPAQYRICGFVANCGKLCR